MFSCRHWQRCRPYYYHALLKQCRAGDVEYLFSLLRAASQNRNPELDAVLRICAQKLSAMIAGYVLKHKLPGCAGNQDTQCYSK